MAKNVVVSEQISEPLSGARRAKIDIHAGDGNLTIDRLSSGEQVLASGSLEYTERQGLPSSRLEVRGDEAWLSVSGYKDMRPRFHFPWSVNNGATNWLIHLNPEVESELTARSNGGNIKLDLSDMSVTSLTTDTGGGNIEMVLPDRAVKLIVNAKTGAGNVVVSIPGGVAARIDATTGLGKVIADTRFCQINKTTYQSPDYETAAYKAEITASSGAGNVSINTV